MRRSIDAVRCLPFLVLTGCWTAMPAVAAPPVNELAAKPASCLRDPGKSYWHWLDARVSRGVLRICDLRANSNGDDEEHRASCVGVALATGAIVHQPNEVISPAEPPAGQLRAPNVCAAGGERCRRIGPNLTAALAALGTDEQPVVSADGAYVTAHGVWDVAGDAKLALDEIDTLDPSYGVTYGFLDHMIIAEATPCAGPCTTRRIYWHDGTMIVDGVVDSIGFVALRGDRLAVSDGQLEIYDAPHAKLEHTVAVREPGVERSYENDASGGGDAADPLVELPDGRLAAVTRGDGAIDVVFVDPKRGAITRRIRIPICDWAPSPFDR